MNQRIDEPKIDWPNLEEILTDCTHNRFNRSELDYLHRSYLEIEQIWQAHRNELSEIDYIILGEAPLFGDDKKYIYADAGEPSAFLRPTDFASYDPAQDKTGKSALWKLLKRHNMLVIDLFPYALNQTDTPSLTYRDVHKRGYANFYRTVFNNFTAPKIETIRTANPSTTVLVRYKRTLKMVSSRLEEMGFVERRVRGGYFGIHSTNMGVNRELFATFCA